MHERCFFDDSDKLVDKNLKSLSNVKNSEIVFTFSWNEQAS